MTTEASRRHHLYETARQGWGPEAAEAQATVDDVRDGLPTTTEIRDAVLDIVYGVLYGSASDSRWHECGHGTPFKTRWYNDVVYQIASFMVLKEPTVWRWSHSRHHTDTIIVGRDPEIAVMRPTVILKVISMFFAVPLLFLRLENDRSSRPSRRFTSGKTSKSITSSRLLPANRTKQALLHNSSLAPELA